ncbi:MAG: hypothetical protein WA751_09660 [Candidatus Dormiibacterota bacterium]
MMNLRTVSIAAAALALIGLGATTALARSGRSPESLTMGQVQSVNGSTGAQSCETHGTAGTLTLLLRNGTTETVEVSSATALSESGKSSPSLADICVGDWLTTSGTSSGSVLAASKLSVATPGSFGAVESVDGAAAPGSCGATAGSGSFTVQGWGASPPTWTVRVGSGTTFYQRGTSSATFANLCVGDWAAASGTVTGPDALSASRVGITTPRLLGEVQSVDGTATAGTCGSARSTGSFDQGGRGHTTWTVKVTSSTTFIQPSASSASFASVCVGDSVAAFGSASGTTLTASSVVVNVPVSNHPAGPPGGSQPAQRKDPIPVQPQPIFPGGIVGSGS